MKAQDPHTQAQPGSSPAMLMLTVILSPCVSCSYSCPGPVQSLLTCALLLLQVMALQPSAGSVPWHT